MAARTSPCPPAVAVAPATPEPALPPPVVTVDGTLLLALGALPVVWLMVGVEGTLLLALGALPVVCLIEPVLLEAALPAVLPVLGPVEALLAFTVPVVPAVLPVEGPVLWLPVLLLPEAALPAVLPVLGPVEPVLALPTVGVVPFTLPALALALPVLLAFVESPVLPRDAELPALPELPVLPVTSSWCFDLTRSSPLPLLPPATSPRESELPSPASL